MEAKGIKLGNIADNENLKKIASLGCFEVYEHQKDLSVGDSKAVQAYFMHEMNVRLRQVLVKLDGNAVKTQAGAMQWMAGAVESDTGLGSGASAIGGFLKGAIKGMVSGEKAVMPHYKGNGYLMLEPTYKHIILEDVSSWPGGIVLQDSLFLACEAQLTDKIVMRKKLSSLIGGEGLFNRCISGEGILALESPVPKEELFVFELNDSCVKIDGNMAIAWSNGLEFTVERSSKGLIGSMMNGEGLVNVYRGTGKILMTPTVSGTLMNEGKNKDSQKEKKGGKASKGFFSKVSDAADLLG